MKKLHLLLAFLMLHVAANAQDYWQKVSTPSDKDLLTVSFGNSSTGYIGGTDSTLLKTTDGGKTWSTLPHTGMGYEHKYMSDIVDLKFVSATIGYAVLSNRARPDLIGQVYKTLDGGNSWIKVPEIWTSAYRVFCFDEDNGYLTGATPFAGPTLHKLDHGTWSTVHYLGAGTSYMLTAIDFLNIT
ncbi:MAG TPA: YCF48-related protein, partial [Chitinophagaceae bacterium]|nr:YCF48-related protein [Chitinophagaceae bacterium]